MNQISPLSSLATPAQSRGVCKIEIRNVYGNPTAYPMNGEACTFARLTGKRTLTRAALDEIQALGFTIESTANADWSRVR